MELNMELHMEQGTGWLGWLALLGWWLGWLAGLGWVAGLAGWAWAAGLADFHSIPSHLIPCRSDRFVTGVPFTYICYNT